MGKIRVLIVDDSAFVRKALCRIFDLDPDMEIAGTAASGKEALEKLKSLNPDVITLDIMMPGMDGLETLKRLMEERPTPVLMLSSLTHEGAGLTLKALELGALDFVDKSSAGIMDFFDLAREILFKVKSVAGSKPVRMGPFSAALAPGKPRGLADIVAVGTSTGGPLALQMLLPRFPKGIHFGILVVQHMPQGFTGPLAKRLDALCDIHVKEACEGDQVMPGTALIAPAGLHMTLRKAVGVKAVPEEGVCPEPPPEGPPRSRVKLGEEPSGAVHRPSVDVLFNSVAKLYGSRAIGVLMTGMGSDGAEGMKAIKEKGGFTIAQDEATSAIFGMPRAAIENNAVDKVLPITSIAEEILKKA